MSSRTAILDFIRYENEIVCLLSSAGEGGTWLSGLHKILRVSLLVCI